MLTNKPATEVPAALLRLPPAKVPMSLLLSALSAAGVLECVACSYLMAELAGCWLRRLLHNKKTPFLRRRYVVYHLAASGSLGSRSGEDTKHEGASSKRKRNANVR
jgi:hypothetical protein